MIARALRRSVGLLAAINAFACNTDEIRAIPAPGSLTPVDRLSALGVFEGAPSEQIPRAEFVAYEVNAPLFVNGAHKRRFVYVPRGAKVHLTAGYSDIPSGSYFVKTFSMPLDERNPALGEQLLETRFLLKTDDGLVSATYVWSSDQQDAYASAGNIDIPVSWTDRGGVVHEERYHVPGTSECASCHAGRALGFRSGQLDRRGSYADGTNDQLAHLAGSNVLDEVVPAHAKLLDPFGDGELDQRARSYLDANCGHCHGSGGSAEDTGVLFDLGHTAPPNLPVCRETAEIDGNDHVLVPGHPERSEFLSRMRSSDSSVRMPRGSRGRVDQQGIELLSTWVSSMPKQTCR